MTTQTFSSLGKPSAPLNQTGNKRSSQLYGMWRLLRTNYEMILALITLIALLTGWLGGSVTHSLPQWLVNIVALIAFVAGGYSGVTGAIVEARKGRLDIDFLMIAAALGAALIGEWEEGALLLFLFTLSGALETFAMDRTRNAIEALSELRPDVALVKLEEGEKIVPVAELVPGNVVLVRPGERLPVDGTIVKGNSSIDQSAITGESTPVYRALNDFVYAGTINGSGAIDVRVDRPAGESTLSKIIALVEEARTDAAPTQRFIDRFSQPYTYAVISATLLAIVLPWLFSHEPFPDTLYRAMTLLVVASPCALIISTPASILSAIASAARQGVLFKGGAHLEAMSKISVIAFDKTGTLTRGKPAVTDLLPTPGVQVKELLSVAAGAEFSSQHPLANAIVEKARAEGLHFSAPHQLEAVAGHGVVADYENGSQVLIGNEKLFASQGVELPTQLKTVGDQLRGNGKTAMLVAQRLQGSAQGDIRFLGWLAVADQLRSEASNALQSLRQIGIERTIMLTGDNSKVAATIGNNVGIDEVHSELLPEQKVEVVRQLSQTRQVAMVGDGVNDAPALAAANVGIAIGAGGTDAALETADVVLMSGDLSRLPFAINLGRSAERIVRQNVIFSVGVIVTLVLTTLLLPILLPGFRLPLPLGVVGHEGSTLLVVLNGLRLLAMKP
ncbi:MAG: heavy metal translocating P-type ATPase [Caldilineaceae bacterium]